VEEMGQGKRGRAALGPWRATSDGCVKRGGRGVQEGRKRGEKTQADTRNG